MRLTLGSMVWDEEHAVFAMAMSFTGLKSGSLVTYTVTGDVADLGDMLTATEDMVGDAYAYFGITPP